MAMLDEFSGTVVRVAAHAAAERRRALAPPVDEAAPEAPVDPALAREIETRVERAVVEATSIAEESVPRLFEVLHALAEQDLDAITRVRVFPADELESGGALIDEHRVVVDYEPGMKPKRKKKPLQTGPRIVRAAEKRAAEPAAPVAPVAPVEAAVSADAAAATAAPAAEQPASPAAEPELLKAPPGRVRPKPRGRFTTAGQLHGFGAPASAAAIAGEAQPLREPGAARRPEGGGARSEKPLHAGQRFGGERKPFGGERKPFGGERKPFGGGKKPFGGGKKPFAGAKRFGGKPPKR